MRILTEDRKNGTEVLLVTSPVDVYQIVLGKFLASLTVFLVMFASTFIYLAIIYILDGKPEIPMLIGGYIGIPAGWGIIYSNWSFRIFPD